MKNTPVSNKDIYEAINDLRKEMTCRVDSVESEVKAIDNWRNRVVGQFSVIMVFIGIGINYIFDMFTTKK
jgi:hypothetical protein